MRKSKSQLGFEVVDESSTGIGAAEVTGRFTPGPS